jgi:plasmid stabilization system protein ParE
MAELTWTAEAERWLRDIYDYIAQDNPAAAIRTVEAIYQKAEILREFPESGYRYRQRPDRHLGLPWSTRHRLLLSIASYSKRHARSGFSIFKTVECTSL